MGYLVHRDGTPATKESVVALLTEHKISCNHQRDKAADRGTNVHDALEQWARSNGEFFPTPQNFPEEERPYVEGLLQFLDDAAGTKPVLCEVMVGSIEHGFAGRYDLVVEITEPVSLVSKTYPKREAKREEIEPGRYLVDLKTSSGIYPTSHFRQLAAYELASVEGGYPKTDGQFVLHVTKDGKYEFVRSNATADDFLAVLRTWQSNERLKGKS